MNEPTRATGLRYMWQTQDIRIPFKSEASCRFLGKRASSVPQAIHSGELLTQPASLFTELRVRAKPSLSSCLESQSCRELESPWSAGSEDSTRGGDGRSEPRGVVWIVGIWRERVGKPGVVQIADAEDIRHVEDVEGFADQVDAVVIRESDGAVEAEIERVETVVEAGAVADLRQDDILVRSGFIDASGSISLGDEGIELLCVVEFASARVALHGGYSLAAVGKQNI